MVQKWLRGPDFQLLKALNGFPGNFLTYHQSQDSQSTFDDEELEAWGSEAKRWARVLFLVADSTEHIRPLFKVFICMKMCLHVCIVYMLL